jgi:hypothetical protein
MIRQCPHAPWSGLPKEREEEEEEEKEEEQEEQEEQEDGRHKVVVASLRLVGGHHHRHRPGLEVWWRAGRKTQGLVEDLCMWSNDAGAAAATTTPTVVVAWRIGSRQALPMQRKLVVVVHCRLTNDWKRGRGRGRAEWVVRARAGPRGWEAGM